MTVSEENDILRRLLRRAINAITGTVPADVAAWWAEEQVRLANEQAAREAARAARRADLAIKIQELQALYDSLA